MPCCPCDNADLLEDAWNLIANADNNLSAASIDRRDDRWAQAARRWRDRYHEWLQTEITAAAG